MARAKAGAGCVAAGLLLLLAFLAPAHSQTGPGAPAAATAAEFALLGRVAHPRVVTTAELEHLTPTTVDVSFMTEHGQQHGRYTGYLLWALLDRAGMLDEPGTRTRLRHTILARGRDGYSVALALAELDPDFEGKPIVIAYARDNKPLSGLRLVVPGDKHGGRSVRDLVAIEMR